MVTLVASNEPMMERRSLKTGIDSAMMNAMATVAPTVPLGSVNLQLT
jgi:hypothetical protein